MELVGHWKYENKARGEVSRTLDLISNVYIRYIYKS